MHMIQLKYFKNFITKKERTLKIFFINFKFHLNKALCFAAKLFDSTSDLTIAGTTDLTCSTSSFVCFFIKYRILVLYESQSLIIKTTYPIL